MKYFLYYLIIIAVLGLTGCDEGNKNSKALSSVRIAVLPDQDKPALRKRFAPLIEYLAAETGLQVTLVFAENYGDLLKLFERQEIDMARFGGLTYIKAQKRYHAKPLVMRDVDFRFSSHYLISATDRRTSINEFKGKRLAFGSKSSTSGHLMPRYFLQQDNIIPETFFSEVQYSGSHDETVRRVSEGIVDIGVANAFVVDNLIKQKNSLMKNVRVLSQTPPYHDYVWATQHKIPAITSNKLLSAFIKLSLVNKQHEAILKNVNANYYLPAKKSDYDKLKKIAEDLKLLEK